ncbi:hypothetical protein HG530_006838 [Fusarium avenaceum]|nr:hypothetical protein HG530_006838 [Fusarium avenaceum]
MDVNRLDPHILSPSQIIRVGCHQDNFLRSELDESQGLVVRLWIRLVQLQAGSAVGVHENFETEIVADSVDCFFDFRPGWLRVPSADQSLLGLCIKCVVDIFRLELLSKAFTVGDKVLSSPFESELGCFGFWDGGGLNQAIAANDPPNAANAYSDLGKTLAEPLSVVFASDMYVDKGERRNGLVVLLGQFCARLVEPIDNALINPVLHPAALVIVAAATIEEPQDEIGAAIAGVLAVGWVYREVVISGARSCFVDHFLSARSGEHLLANENVVAVNVVIVVVVTIGRCPGKTAVNNGLDDHVDVMCAVVLERRVAIDKISIENYKIRDLVLVLLLIRLG